MGWPGDPRTREERLATNTCNLCAGWLLPGSDERLLAIKDYKSFIRKITLYRNKEERDLLWEEWKRRDRERHRLT